MEKILQLMIFSISILCIRGDDSDYCYANDKTPYEYFSTYTSYDLVKGATVKEEGKKKNFNVHILLFSFIRKVVCTNSEILFAIKMFQVAVQSTYGA